MGPVGGQSSAENTPAWSAGNSSSIVASQQTRLLSYEPKNIEHTVNFFRFINVLVTLFGPQGWVSSLLCSFSDEYHDRFQIKGSQGSIMSFDEEIVINNINVSDWSLEIHSLIFPYERSENPHSHSVVRTRIT